MLFGIPGPGQTPVLCYENEGLERKEKFPKM